MIGMEKAMSVGFEFNQNGQITGLNGNIFAEHILQDLIIIYTSEGIFYNYDEGAYYPVKDSELQAYLMDELHAVVNHAWRPSYEAYYMESLRRKTTYEGELNPHKNYINLENGMLDLESLTLKPHSSKYYSTVQLPFEYNETADCPQFEQYLMDVFENDEERVRLAQEWMGYLLTPNTQAQKALILYGAGGNGKGIFTSIIEALVGKDNISYASLNEINNQFVRATLHGKQLLLSNENEFDKRLNTEMFKKIVGGDTYVTASHKGKKPFEFKPQIKIVLSMNSLPDTKDKSEGYYRRLCFLHFSKHFSIEDGSADVNLLDKLLSELPGILNWGLEGLARLKENEYRFSSCQNAQDLLQQYRTEQNPFLDFIEECIVTDLESVKARVDNKVMYLSFKKWCRDNGHKWYADMSFKKFWREFDNAMIICGHQPPPRRKSGDTRYCIGISIRKGYMVTEEKVGGFSGANNHHNYP